MSYELNKKVQNLEPYMPIDGSYAVRLDANESYFDTGELLSDKITERLSKVSFNRYPDSLCKNLIKGFGKYYNVSPEQVIASNGSDEIIGVILGSFLERGSTVVTLPPDFSMYRFYTDIYEHKLVTIHKDPDYKISPDAVIETANKNSADIIIFSNPCNPTSVGMVRDDVLKIIKNVSSLVVVDEAYMEFWNQSVLPELDNFDNLIVLKTCSKALGCAGIRLGFAVASKPIIKALCAVKSPYNVNSLTQAAGEVIFENTGYIDIAVKSILESKDFLYQKLLELKKRFPSIQRVIQSNTNFIVVESHRAKEIYGHLLSASIAVRYTEGFLRITVGRIKENEILIEELSKILAQMEWEI